VTRWYVVHSHPASEAKAMENLERQGFAAYLPRYRKLRRHARRHEQVMRPLFPRYLFVAVDLMQQRWRPILSTIGVADVVRRGDVPTAVPDDVIEAIRAGEDAGAFDDIGAVGRLRRGDSVQLVAGPFADCVGRFCRLSDADRVIVLLDLLGREIRAEVPRAAVAPA
jgi:transcriptional antiterminator RfaH